jgi:hypothetical protein
MSATCENGNPVYRGFVVFQTENDYTVLTERDKKTYIMPKVDGKIPVGELILINSPLDDDIHIVKLECVMTPTRMWSAIREYTADLQRHKRRYNAKKKSKVEVLECQ